ncbi:MAG: hypothetical protein HUU21_28155, partial [Polyangiaceae bacterium]|nr:hypothetical protein [Polyangiaceae bacterium]
MRESSAEEARSINAGRTGSRLPRMAAALIALSAVVSLGIAGGCGRTAVFDGVGEAPSGGGETCGNLTCAAGETCTSCPPDCGVCPGCGDGVCGGTEQCASCAQDCGVCSVCGNGKCEDDQFETCSNCNADCGPCETIGCFEIVLCAIGGCI